MTLAVGEALNTNITPFKNIWTCGTLVVHSELHVINSLLGVRGREAQDDLEEIHREGQP